jgi:hypothetical protein
MRRPTRFDLAFVVLGVGLALLVGVGTPLLMFQ